MLYQTVRPGSWDEVVGNGAVVRALQKAATAQNRAHSFLFTGPAGCGKTTLARIFAAACGCKPVNIVEVNAANERGIELSRNLANQSQYPPMGGGHRVVILDEAHQLTKDAQGALLKVLEDIPSYQSYVLCTTDPAKVLETIKTRCEKVVVARLSRDELMEALLLACAKGNIKEPSEAVLAAIVRASDGCPREALVTLEKVEGVEEVDALKLVVPTGGATGEVLDLCRALGKKPWKALTSLLSRIEEDEQQSVEPEGIRLAVLGYLAACLAGSESNEDAARFTAMIEPLCDPVYTSGRAGLLAGLYRAQEASMNLVKK